jgi:hypothetical protein
LVGKPARLARAVFILGCVAAILAVATAGCGSGAGVCTACCGPGGQTYCKDNWTESECSEWSAMQVNGLSWNFHEGQTCEERGTPATP